MKLPTSQTNLVTRLFTGIRADKVIIGEDIITNIEDLRINSVKVDGNAVRIFGNKIEGGYYAINDVKNSEDEKIGISIRFDEYTAQLWNSSEMRSLEFVFHNTQYRFTFVYDF